MDGPDKDLAADHERRAREIADTWRRYVIGINSGALVIVSGLAGTLAQKGTSPSWAALPGAFYAISLLITGYSFALAKRKAIGRRDAARNGEAQPDYSAWCNRNTTWDWLALFIFALGAVATVLGLWFWT